MNTLARELFGDVANRYDAPAPQNDPFDVVRAMGKAEDTAWRNELVDLPGGNGEAAFTQAKEHEGLIESSKASIPAALFMAEGERKSLQPRHGGHFLDGVHQKGGACIAKDEHERAGCERQTEVDSAVDHKKRLIAAFEDMADLWQGT